MLPLIQVLTLAIEAVGSLIIALFVVAALWRLAVTRSIAAARYTVAQGALAGLTFKVAATLMKTIVLESWRQIAVFAVVLSLRTVLKRLFAWEQQRAAARYPRLGSHFTSGTPAR